MHRMVGTRHWKVEGRGMNEKMSQERLHHKGGKSYSVLYQTRVSADKYTYLRKTRGMVF